MKPSFLCGFGLLMFSGVSFTAAALNAGSLPNQQSEAASQNRTIAEPSGEEVFKVNCSRCHMPPMSLSPRTTGTVIMHMRTRARLSRRDEKLLLRYLAP
jgi:cytochrome c5